MLLFYYIAYFIITNCIVNIYSQNTNLSTTVSYDYDDDIYDVSQYRLYFKSSHFVWNHYNEWTWNSSNNNSINTTIACSKRNPSLCIHTQFTTNTHTKQIEFFKSLTIHYKDTNLPQNDIILDFWDDLHWSQVNILHHNDANDAIDRRQLLHSALSSKYDNMYYDYDAYNNMDQDAFAVHELDEDDDISDIDTMEKMNAYLFDQNDAIEDIYNIDDYYKYYDRMSAEEWGVFKKIWKGVKKAGGRLARAIGNRVGIYARPPCSGSSRCRVHLYKRRNFRSRFNKKGHFCEGRWDRWRLHKYRVNTRKTSSAMVQGSPCCVLIAYNGYKFDGDMQAMFPRGRYPSMSMGLSTSMGTGNGMNGMGGGGMMGMMGGGMGMMGAGMHGFRNRALSSMKIVHDCALRQRLMRRASGRWSGMHGGMPGMMEMMQMMMMMRMMFPNKHGHMHGLKKKGHATCGSYSCIVKTQQNQLQQLMHMMMMSSMANQAPITIADHTKKGRRIMAARDRNNMHVIGIKKCKMLYFTEICVVFDAVNNKIDVDSTVKYKKEINATDADTHASDVLLRIDSMFEVLSDVIHEQNEGDIYEEEEYIEDDEEEEVFEDIEQWIDPDPIDLFLDYVGVDSEVSEFANRYHDDSIAEDVDVTDIDDDEVMDEYGLKYDPKQREAQETQHRMRLYMGSLTYGMLRNELIFSDEFGYDLQSLDLEAPTDNDIINYFDTFILESHNANDWLSYSKMNGSKCNDIILSYISHSICVSEKGVIYFERNKDGDDSIYDDGVKLFYERTHDLVVSEFDDMKLDIMTDADWKEIYEIQEEAIERKKLCNYISMIKICVEGDTNTLWDDYKISIEYLSDEVSKQMIRENNEIFNEWMLWSDFY